MTRDFNHRFSDFLVAFVSFNLEIHIFPVYHHVEIDKKQKQIENSNGLCGHASGCENNIPSGVYFICKL